jgi:hypothetical protein
MVDMRRKQHRETKVWRDPLVAPSVRRRDGAEPSGDEEKVNAKRNRKRVGTMKRTGAKIVAGPRNNADPREVERERLLYRVLAAEGRPAISRAAEDFFEAGFELPKAQEPWLQLLEHKDEERVVEAIESLTAILDGEPPRRRAVLESRLHRIEEYADELSTQRAAGELRRALKSKRAETLT